MLNIENASITDVTRKVDTGLMGLKGRENYYNKVIGTLK